MDIARKNQSGDKTYLPNIKKITSGSEKIARLVDQLYNDIINAGTIKLQV